MNDILFGNNNKAAIKRLAGRSFKKSKIRNIAAILAIAMTAFLFTSITSLGFGVMESLTLTQQIQKGSKADGDIRYMTAEQFETLQSSEMVERAGSRQVIGFLTNTTAHTVELDYADSIQQELTFCKPTNGNAPQAANEIATSDLALQDLGIEPVIGTTVPVEFELRGETHRFNMVLSGWWEASSPQVSLMTVSQAFIDENRELFPNTYATDREISGTWLSDVVLKDKTDIAGQLEAFARSVGGDPEDMYADNYILCAANQTANTPIDGTMLAALAVFAILFVAGGYLLIYNIFDISIMQDVRQYGLLRTIGASTRQIKRIVNRQAIRLTVIGLPIGLVAGYFVGRGLLPLVIRFFSYNSQTATQMSASPLIFLIAALFTALTVWISTRKPVRKASKVSPLEAIRFTGQENEKKKATRRKKGAKLPRMALANLGRNRRRSAFIIISMLLCMVLLNSVITAAQSMDTHKFVSRNTKTDFTVYNAGVTNRTSGYSTRADGLTPSVPALIDQQPGVSAGRVLYKNTVDDTAVTVDYGFSGLAPMVSEQRGGRTFDAYDNGGILAVSQADGRPYGNVCGVSDAFLRDLTIHDGETDPNALVQQMNTGNYMIAGSMMNKLTGTPSNSPFEGLIQPGQTISIYKNGELFKTYTVLATATLVMTETETLSGTIGANRVGGDAPFLYLPQQEFASIYDQPTLLSYGFDVQEEYRVQMADFLDAYTSTQDATVAFTSTELMRAQLQSVQLIVLSVGGIIGVILALAGLINFTNMMITNIIARRHEFATMQSIGMTARQLRRMMTWEGVYYAAGAGVFGLLLSVLLGQTVLCGVLNAPSMWFFTFQFTVLPALVIFVIYLMIALVVPSITLRVFNKGSVVQRLRAAE